MMPGPAWYGGAVFQGPLKTPKGQIAVAPALHWARTRARPSPATSAAAPGGSPRTARTSGRRSDFATWVTTSDAYQADLAPGYPAYTAAATKWLAKQQASGYWANDIAAPISAAAEPGLVGLGLGRSSARRRSGPRSSSAGMTAGQDHRVAAAGLADARSSNQAKVLGYTVTQ